MEEVRKQKEMAKKIAVAVKAAGGDTYYVGGCVRDFLLGKECKDVDIEVHGITSEKLESILDGLGSRIEIGKSFGVYNLKGCSIDIALPRKERAVGQGHRDFVVGVDPFIGTLGAAKRRDFTINALMQNVLTDEIIDHFNGKSDLENKIIRHVCDQSFGEDPLRVFRAAQFASRFEFTLAEETKNICKNMRVDTLSKERVFEELSKALLKSQKPSIFFEILREIGKLSEFFPELEALIGVKQNEKHHSEGDVWVHTMMVLDESAKRRESVSNKIGFMLSALVHDFGKAITTEIVNGEIHAYGHEVEGLPIVKTFLSRICNEKKLIAYVLNMTELHMKPNALAAMNASIKSTNKLFDKSFAPFDLIQLAIADSLGKTAMRDYYETEPFLLERLDVYNEYMSRDYIKGKDLVELGLKPNKEFSEMLKFAHKLRLVGIPKEAALKQTISEFKKKKEVKKYE